MNPEEIPLNANIFSITDLTLPLTMLPARDRITGQIKRTALPRSASPCKRKEANRICGHGGIGRLGGFRFHCESVQVRVLLPAPRKGRPEGLPFLGAGNRTRRGRHRQRRGKKHACDMFFARGRVHGTLTAAGRAVGSVSYGSQPTSGNIVISVSTGENANRVLSPAPNSRPLLIQFVSVRVGFLFNCDCLLDISYVIIKT